MSGSPDLPQENSPDSTIDGEMARILEQYLQDQEAGTAEPRDEWLAKHPRHADRLAACLDGVELMGAGGFLIGDVHGKSEIGPAPKTIGDYEIIGELGRGGMGVVYEAREKSLDRIVALKVMRFGVVDPKALDRFQREAETAGDLHHTNIVPVYATGREGDTSWYAMQRIEGDSLAKRIDDAKQSDTPIQLAEIISFGVQAAEALDHAHQRDVIHRDVKPANLIVDGEDRVWLTDFGLARRLADVGATMTGAMMGTPRYMSPEQASLKGDNVDCRTDIYSLGATLFELATGEPPFTGDDPLKVISRIRYEDAKSIRHSRPDLPRDLDVVLAKCMEKDTKRRYASAAELAADLRAIGDDRAISARPISIFERAARATRKHGARFRVAGLAMLVTAATILFSLVAWQSFSESKLGSFRFRAGGGPFVSTVHPIGGNSLSANARNLTVPMQVPAELIAGDYDMTLAPRGKWSRKVRLSVAKGEQSEFRMGASGPKPREIEIDQADVVAVAGFQESGALIRKDGKLKRVTASGRDEWESDVSNIETSLLLLSDPTSQPKSFNVDFANTALVVNSRQHRALFEKNPQYAAPHVALTTPIDLDSDGKSDTIVAAFDKSSLLAIDSKGDVLWACSYDLNGDFAKGNPSNPPAIVNGRKQRLPKVNYPGVMGLLDAGDQNGDSVNDLVASLIHIRPGIQTDTSVVLISGKSGEVISSVPTPSISVADRSRWPVDGMLRTDRYFGRDSGSLRFNEHGVVRDRISWSLPQVSWSNGSGQPKFAVPSPIKIAQAKSESNAASPLYAIQHIDDQCHVIDMADASVLHTIQLPIKNVLAPRIARLADQDFALIFHETDLSFRSPRTEDGTIVLAYRASNGERLWRHVASYVDWQQRVGNRSRTDWPLVADVNSDGADEVLLPTARYRNKAESGVRMLDALTGKSIWSTEEYPVKDSADETVNRMAVSADIDGDGWREWAIATIGSDPSNQLHRSQRQDVGDAYVYVDWISGKNGRSLAWARAKVPILSDQISVAEIDAIRCDIPGGDSGTIEIDLVTGDSRDDLELDSLVARFHPSSPDPVAIAAGVEAIASPPVSGALPNGAQKRVFYARPGPYAEGPERLVFLGDRPSDATRLGERDLVGTWAQSGTDYLALSGGQPRKLVVVDAATHRMLWQWQDNQYPDAEFTMVGDNSNGSLGVLLRTSDLPLVLLDAKTGRTKWTMSDSVYGGVKFAKLIDDKRLLIVGDGRVATSGFPKPPDYFKMSMVDPTNGQILWAKHFLWRAPRVNTPNDFNDLQFVDVNGDGVLDVVGPDQEKDEQLQIAVWDGASGNRLWARSLKFRGSRSDYFVFFRLVNRNGKPTVVYYGPDGEFYSLIVCDAATGEKLLSTPPMDIQHRFVDRSFAQEAFDFADCSTSDTAIIGLLASDRSGNSRWDLFDISGDEAKLQTQQILKQELPDDGSKARDQGWWLRDWDGDGQTERLISSRVSNGSDYFYVLRAYDMKSSDPIWTAKSDVRERPRRIRSADEIGASFAWIEYERSLRLLDLASGKELHRVETLAANPYDRPLVTRVHKHNGGTALRLARPVKEGVVNRWVGALDDVPASTEIHHSKDPRRLRSRFDTKRISSNSAWDTIVWSLRSMFALVVLVIIPFTYVGRIFREKRFSLSWMLLAPVVAILFLLVWNSQWIQKPGPMLYVFNGIGVIMVPAVFYLAFRRTQSDSMPYRRRLLLFAILVSFVIFLAVFYNRDGGSDFHYQFVWNDVLLILWLSICVVAQLFCYGALVRWVFTWPSRRRAKRVGQTAGKELAA